MGKRSIRAKELLDDIKAGMDDAALMEKHGLSAKGLQGVFDKLLEKSVISLEELHNRGDPFDDTVSIGDLRMAARSYLMFHVPIHEAEHLENEGYIEDVSIEGIQVSGLSCEEGDVMNLLIRADSFQQISPFVFEARCQWAHTNENGENVAGFRITDISNESQEQLQFLIRLLTLGSE
jgi:hypothetical protein